MDELQYFICSYLWQALNQMMGYMQSAGADMGNRGVCYPAIPSPEPLESRMEIETATFWFQPAVPICL